MVSPSKIESLNLFLLLLREHIDFQVGVGAQHGISDFDRAGHRVNILKCLFTIRIFHHPFVDS